MSGGSSKSPVRATANQHYLSTNQTTATEPVLLLRLILPHRLTEWLEGPTESFSPWHDILQTLFIYALAFASVPLVIDRILSYVYHDSAPPGVVVSLGTINAAHCSNFHGANYVSAVCSLWVLGPFVDIAETVSN